MADPIEALYSALPAQPDLGWRGPIHPFIGACFREEGPDGLRAMVVGVNAYVAPNSWPEPATYAEGFREQWWRFDRGVLRDVNAVADALAGAPAWPDPYRGIDSIYLTNAVKRWLPQNEGRHAHRAAERWFTEGEAVFAQELTLLAERRRLPHLVIVVGHRSWGHVWPAFGRATLSFVKAYRPQPGPLFHHLNAVDIEQDGVTRTMLLMRLRHPSASHFKHRWTPEALTAHPVFRQVAGLDER